MRKILLTALLALTGVFSALKAQDTLTLQQCIDYALRNNLQVQRSLTDLGQQTNNYARTKANILPSLNASASNNYNFGRTIDPSTNQFANQQINSNYFSLNSEVVLFQGLKKINEIRQAKWAEEASDHDLQRIKDNISLNIANQYLQILLLRERDKQIRSQIKLSSEMVEKNKILLDAGAVTQTKLLEAEAQQATNQAQLVDVQNQTVNAYLALKQQMNYDITASIAVANVDFPDKQPQYNTENLNGALNKQINELPGILQARSNRESALYGLKAAQGAMSPRLTMGASLNTIYSSQGKNYTYTIGGVEPIGYVGSDSSAVYAPKLIPNARAIPYNEQIKNNFGQSLGFTLAIPIFNGLQTRYNVQNARFNLSNAALNVTEVETQARNDIYKAYEAMNNAAAKMQASQTRLNAQDRLFEQSDIMYRAGAMNYFEFITSRNNLDSAQIDLLQAKYEYIFQTKIFEYYSGMPIKF